MQDRRQIKNTDNTQTKHNPEKSKQHKTQQNKTTLIQSSLMTLSQETRWAYSTTLPEPTRCSKRYTSVVTAFSDSLQVRTTEINFGNKKT